MTCTVQMSSTSKYIWCLLIFFAHMVCIRFVRSGQKINLKPCGVVVSFKYSTHNGIWIRWHSAYVYAVVRRALKSFITKTFFFGFKNIWTIRVIIVSVKCDWLRVHVLSVCVFACGMLVNGLGHHVDKILIVASFALCNSKH